MTTDPPGWKPGLWLANDQAAVAEEKPRVSADSAAVVAEFARVFGWSANAAPLRGHGGARAVQRSTRGTTLRRGTLRPAPGKDPPNYPIADAIASQNTVKSPANGCGPCSITCSLRKFPSASNVAANEMNPASFSKVFL
jgi:hypothetical protein